MDEKKETELEVLDNEQLEAVGEEIQEGEVEVEEEIEEEAEEEKPDAEPEKEIQDEETLEREKEPEKQELILGKFKTEEELEAYIADSVKNKADEKRSEIQEEEAIKRNEQEYQARILQISKSVDEIDQAKADLKRLLYLGKENGGIDAEEYAEAIQKAEELRMQKAIEYGRLESSKHLIVKPKVQKENTLYYQKLEETIPELKQDPLVKKYTSKLKAEVFDNSGIKIEGSFEMYVKEYIIGLAKESEERGYKKALEEQELNKLKAKQKTIAGKSTKQPKKETMTREQRLLNELTN